MYLPVGYTDGMRAMLAWLVLLLLLVSPFPVRGDDSPPERILVSAAISLRNAFEEIGRLLRTRSGIVTDFNFGASGLLQRQIEAGAPVDVFASAGATQMDELQAKGLILQDSRRDFARNALELIVPAGQKITFSSFSDLSGPGLRRLAIGNPRTVPAGHYAEQTLRSLKIWETLQSRLILAEDVRQVLDYVVRGEVDAGIVYATDVPIAAGRVFDVARAPEQTHDPILYPVAVVKDARQKGAALRFVDLVSGADGQKILAKYGFLGRR